MGKGIMMDLSKLEIILNEHQQKLDYLCCNFHQAQLSWRV